MYCFPIVSETKVSYTRCISKSCKLKHIQLHISGVRKVQIKDNSSIIAQQLHREIVHRIWILQKEEQEDEKKVRRW